MKCPKCGREIEDGSLFCKYCFAEIRIVPTYDSTVEQKISETMDKVKDEVDLETYKEERLQKKEAERRKQEKRQRRIILCISLALVFVVTAVIAVAVKRYNSPSYYIGLAYELAAEGNYSEAADEITRAQQLQEDSDPSLMLLKADYLARAGRKGEALASIQLIIEGQEPDSEYVVNAYGRMIELYAQDGEYDTINEVLQASGNEKIKEIYSQYLVLTPSITPTSGNYDHELDVEMAAAGPGSIFYTLDGSVPTTNSLLYTGPVHLSRGEYTVRAVYINPFGLSGNVMSRSYRITN